ncbi:MAG TPA: GvpL/GvpF family gas vesicle protein [Candidatus Limnocylindria bacterium]|nr:GvpL/GvpF family gas vesicle protein [Candidatus Limnocylindria bacterium]
MRLLLRAIVATGDADAATTPDLHVVSAADVAALASPWPERRRAAGEEDLLEHHRIVQAIFERVPCLPARFGSIFDDEQTLRERLAARGSDLGAQLARLGHRCELAITCAWQDELEETRPLAPASSGRAYMERGRERARLQDAREARAREIVARLTVELAIDPALIRHRTCPRPAVAVSMSALVTRDEMAEVSSRIERLGKQLPDVTTIVQGPWAPYTFAVNE